MGHISLAPFLRGTHLLYFRAACIRIGDFDRSGSDGSRCIQVRI